MASYTKITWIKREQRHDRMGKRRKAANRNHGTTPAFDVHAPHAVANAPVEQLRAADRTKREG